MFEELVKSPSKWLSEPGPSSEIVISSRVRLARNVNGFPFSHNLNEKDAEELVGMVSKAVEKSKLFKGVKAVDLLALPELDRIVLMERHIMSYDHVINDRKRAVVFSKDESLSVMINEEAPLRLQILLPGIQLTECYAKLDKLDTELEKKITYAYDIDVGYLSACPTNTGTGLRASVMVHLPGLVISKEITKVLNNIAQMGLVARGFYGEGIDIKTPFFQISNQVSLGHSEAEIINEVDNVTKKLIDYEKKARESLFRNERTATEDNIWRSYGILKNVRSIKFEEAITLLSSLRLGIESGIVKADIRAVNELLIITQPGHIQKLFTKDMNEHERDQKRAEIIRGKLA